MTKLHELADLGQAIWLDDIRREYFNTGSLAGLVDQGLRGLTSNPSIFDKAITGSADYDEQFRSLVQAGKSEQEIYEALVIDDIRKAADVLRKVYDQTGGADGFVSLEVSPGAAFDTQATIDEATRLFKEVNRPNLMIKIPATDEGTPAIEACIARGLNINVTLIFSIAQYEAVTEAYLSGLEKLAAGGKDISKVSSVASFFVSRVDSAVDKQLEELIQEGGSSKKALRTKDLLGKAAIANAKMAYACFQEIFTSERWKKLEAQGARVQRPLWASTGTKNPAYPDTLYVDTLIGPHTVNTLPPKTLEAVLDHARVERTIDQDMEAARAEIKALDDIGIDLDEVTRQLLADGVTSFAKSFDALMQGIADKRGRLQLELEYRQSVKGNLAAYRSAVNSGLADLAREHIVERIWALDHTVWRPDPAEISNRLGWLRIAETMEKELPRLDNLVAEVRAAGYTQALLLGMGGSSLAPEVMRKTFGVKPGYLDLAVLDSTDPGAVRDYAERMDPDRTLIIVSTKSGGTVETFSFFKFFYNWMVRALGMDRAGKHFIAITDPGSKLAEVAQQHGFRATLLSDPNIGGRYSALSMFGLAPAALIGVDLDVLLKRARGMMYACGADGQEHNLAENPAARLGVALGELARLGCDKVTFVTSPAVCTFGDWVEQLIAESTGKERKGILPVVGEALGAPEMYGKDRFFVYLRLTSDHSLDVPVLALESAGNPVMRVEMRDLYDLGAQFFLWEMATSIAGQRIDIQPYDQPNVETAKVSARSMVTEYQKSGSLPEPEPTLQEDSIRVFADVQAGSLAEAWKAFLAQTQPGAYVAVQAYIHPTYETDASLLELRTRLRDQTTLAVTTGYGPRFLHSTGQLHKGDQGMGLFVQITSEPERDLAIPNEAGKDDSAISFGVLKAAQALGDRQALLDGGRKVIRFHIQGDVLVGLARLSQALG